MHDYRICVLCFIGILHTCHVYVHGTCMHILKLFRVARFEHRICVNLIHVSSEIIKFKYFNLIKPWSCAHSLC